MLALTAVSQYLFMLFDEENPLHSDDSNYVLTTEGHILFLPKELLKPMSPARRRMRRDENHQCPVYEPPYNWKSRTGLTQGIRSRVDVDYARYLTGMLPEKADVYLASPDGWCEKPHVDVFVSFLSNDLYNTHDLISDGCQSYDFILSGNGQVVPEDVNPSARKLQQVFNGYILHNISGIRTHIVSRLDGKGYDITKRTDIS